MPQQQWGAGDQSAHAFFLPLSSPHTQCTSRSCHSVCCALCYEHHCLRPGPLKQTLHQSPCLLPSPSSPAATESFPARAKVMSLSCSDPPGAPVHLSVTGHPLDPHSPHLSFPHHSSHLPLSTPPPESGFLPCLQVFTCTVPSAWNAVPCILACLSQAHPSN